MPRPKSKRAINIRELKRTGDSLNRAIAHIYEVAMSYQDHKQYLADRNLPETEHVKHMIDGCEYIAEQIGKLQTLVVLMAKDIDAN